MSTNYIDDIKPVKKSNDKSSSNREKPKSKKQSKNSSSALFFLVGIIIVFLALYFGYYYGKNKGINIGYFQAKGSGNTLESTKSANATKKTAADSSDSESNEKTYTVKSGDTLFTIGLKFNIEWLKIAEYNGLEEDSVIKEGQVLKIPQSGKETNEEKYEVDIATYQKYQDNVNEGLQKWRLDPVEVCKSTIPPTFGITKSDIYTTVSKNTEVGEATVEITHNGQIYTATLIQPIKKGLKGVWAVTKLIN